MKILRHFPVIGPVTDLAYYTIEGNQRDASRGVSFDDRQRKQTRKLVYAGVSTVATIGIYLLAGKELNTYDPFQMYREFKDRLERPDDRNNSPNSIPIFGLERGNLA